ncbi:YdiU family protein [Paenibacillus sp. PR3]|uniref:Protein nucleotidyltransferase YdiU n=1 Tax=Paenibacillus terricola TaxID=2763503 RepID=A0ABR8MVU0_9BACL|nr:YdiU family protein [Paenibacillus terricola]MBD3919381.1 YdiU family protein [Paenibacillus terricola]
MTNTKAGWNFDNSYTRLPESLFARVGPTEVDDPALVILNEPLAASLGLIAEVLRSSDSTAVFAGNDLPEGADPIAEAYGGHQFGHFNRLGDGRALLLGEQITPDGERFDIQLKGSGRTPYSRGGDGRAAIGPMLREYIISEAMHGLGIPTTRSLAVVTTGEAVYRESVLPGAVLTRIAASHLRVGTFQFAAQWCTNDELRELADYALQRHFSNVDIEEGDNRYLVLFRKVAERQAALIAKWQLVGFIHGVMNTDNMAISGETIDYGPCAFMDAFDPATVFSSIDTQGRYAYGNQPRIGAWNLARLAEALLPLLHEDGDEAVRLAEHELQHYIERYHQHWLGGMRAKLGLADTEEEDEALIQELLAMMQKTKADFTNTFIALTFDRFEGHTLASHEDFSDWHDRWLVRRGRQAATLEEAHQLMRRSNPAVIARNHRVEEALNAAVKHGDYTVMEKLLKVLVHPYAHTEEQAEYAVLPEQQNCNYRTFCGT